MARDFYRLDNAENRYITELIGSVPADYSAFTGGGAFTNMYVTIRSGNTILNNLCHRGRPVAGGGLRDEGLRADHEGAGVLPGARDPRHARHRLRREP